MSKDNGVLSPLVGRKGAKAVIRKALRAGDVHLCFTGPPECGKSVALTAIEDAFDGAVYRDSSDVTKSKLKDILADDPPVLLLEEIDDMSYDAAKALSTALEQGRVTKTNQRKSYDVDISTQVFAAANEFSSLPGHIQTRFGDIHFPQYDRDEFIEVCGELLPRSVSWIDGPETGRAAAETVAEQRGRLSVRAAKRICTLSSSLSDVPTVSRALEDAEADVDSRPVTTDELQENDLGSDIELRPMAQPEQLEDRDPEEIHDLLDDEPREVTLPEGEEWNWDTAINKEEAFGAVQAMRKIIENGNRVLRANSDLAVVQVLAPTPLADHVEGVFDDHELGADVQWGFAESNPLSDDLPELTDEIFAYSFFLSEGKSSDLSETGYEINQILRELGDLPVMAAKSGKAKVELAYEN